MRRSPNKKTKLTLARLALLRFTPARLARLSSRMWRLTASPTRCGIVGLRVEAVRLPALPSAQPPTSHGARLSALPGAAQGRCLPALSHSHHLAAAYEHRRVAVSCELHVPMSLHSLSSKEMFALKLHVASICFKCFRGML
jgi:hypothetical protein